MQIADWHKRYLEQAQWTKTLRRYLLAKIPMQTDWSVLEFGCSTGVILRDFLPTTKVLIGLDLDLNALAFQSENQALLVNGDAYHPPFQKHSFDLIYCHYFLLWLTNPAKMLDLAKMLLKPGGYLLIFAEPDYASRQTTPERLGKLANFQNKSLAAQGACLETGRTLGKLLSENGFSILEFGSFAEPQGVSKSFTELEKMVLRADWNFLDLIGKAEIRKKELEELLTLTPERWFIPTYYALAKLNN